MIDRTFFMRRPVLALFGAAVSTVFGAPAKLDTTPLSTLPMRFERNVGQTAQEVQFVARGSGYAVFLSPSVAILTLAAPKTEAHRGSAPGRAVRMRFLGASSDSTVEHGEPIAARSNYFLGADAARWRTNVPSYTRVHYRNVYPGIDLAYYGNQGRLEYDLVLAPGADPNVIDIQYDGVERLHVDSDGALVLQFPGGELRQHPPLVYQETPLGRELVPTRYELRGKDRAGFHVSRYNRLRPLVIDPVLSFSTYFGGGGFDEGVSIALDSGRNLYITGWTTSLNYPVTAGVFQPSFGGGSILGDVFVSKLDPSGTSLIYSTYLGGAGDDSGWSVAVDAAGNAYVTGNTLSSNFPVTPAGYKRTFGGGGEYGDAFAVKLNAFGSALDYATYLGGSASERGLGVAVDTSGSAYVAGVTASADFPTTAGTFQTTIGGRKDNFLTRLNPAGTALVFSTFIGGAGDDWPNGIALDAQGAAYLAGYTQSGNYPVTPGAFSTTFQSGPGDTFVTKAAPTGASLIYSTYIGGSGDEFLRAIALDAEGNAYVAGRSSSANFPVTAGAYQTVLRGSLDVIVSKLNPTGSALVYSTFLGGTANDQAEGIAVDGTGVAHVTGLTSSTNFPLTPDTYYGYPKGGDEGFLTKVAAAGNALVFSTYFGGSNGDLGIYVAVDSSNATYLLGFTRSADLFITPGAVQAAFAGGSGDSFIARFDPAGSCAYTLSSSAASFPPAGGTGSVTVTTGPNCPWVASNGTSWTAVTSNSSFVGSGTVAYSVAANGGTANRSAIIVIANRNFTITQAGTSCVYSIAPPSQQFDNAGGSGSIAVSAGTGCPWTAASNAGWITVTSGSTGSGNGSVGFAVAAATAPRSGTITVAGQTFSVSQGTFTPIRVNAGGPAYTDSMGRLWAADSGYTGGAAYVSSNTVNATADPMLYRSERYAPSGMQYQFSVPNGAYLVKLRFAEIWYTAPGQRVFNVSINGQQVLANFDIVAQAGGPRMPLDRQFAVAVSTGQIAIQFTKVLENPKLSALEILPDTGVRFSIAPPRASLTAGQTQAFTGTVSGSANTGVSWSLSSPAGSIAPNGVYTSPGNIAATTYVGVIGVPAADPNQSETAIVTLSPGCTYSLSATSASFNLGGGSSTIGISTQSGCPWSAVSNDGWIVITAGSSGTGPGSISYSVSNASGGRSGSMTVAGIGFSVSQAPFALRVNAGGPAYTDPLGQMWSADTGFNGGNAYVTTAPIANTTTPVLYQSERFSPAPSGLQYQFSVPNGSYTVKLKFAEIWFTASGMRSFNVVINGQQVLANFDIFAQAGAKSALDKVFPITVVNGQVTIQFTKVVENPKVSAIEIY